MMIEYEPNLSGPKHARKQKVGVGRITCLNHIEWLLSKKSSRQARRVHPRIGALPGKPDETVDRLGRVVLQQRDAIERLSRRVIRSFRTNHRNLVAGANEGLALKPNSAIKWHRQILHNDQYMAGTGVVGRGGTTHSVIVVNSVTVVNSDGVCRSASGAICSLSVGLEFIESCAGSVGSTINGSTVDRCCCPVADG